MFELDLLEELGSDHDAGDVLVDERRPRRHRLGKARRLLMPWVPADLELVHGPGPLTAAASAGHAPGGSGAQSKAPAAAANGTVPPTGNRHRVNYLPDVAAGGRRARP